MKTSINFKWQLQRLQELIEKIEELKKNNPELLKDCTITFDVSSYTITI